LDGKGNIITALHLGGYASAKGLSLRSKVAAVKPIGKPDFPAMFRLKTGASEHKN